MVQLTQKLFYANLYMMVYSMNPNRSSEDIQMVASVD